MVSVFFYRTLPVKSHFFWRCFSLTKDMTVGSPMKLMFNFAIPLMFGNLFQQFYSMVDTIIVGRFLGTGPLAAVGSTGSINFLILGFCLGTCAGFTIPVAQSFGSKDIKDLKRFVGNIVWLAAGFSLIFTIATVVLCRPILQWMDTPADIIDDAYHYIVVIFLGIPTIVLYNVLASLLRALGDSRTPVVFLVIASLLNIGLDLFLIVVIPLGVAGAAWATVISQGLPMFHLEEIPPAPHLPGRFDSPEKLHETAAWHGRAHGTAKLHHRGGKHFAANLRERTGLCGGGFRHRGQQTLSAVCLRL